MASSQIAPGLIGLLIGLTLGLIVKGLRPTGHDTQDGPVVADTSDRLIGLLVLAAFALGILVAYTVLGFRG